MSNTRYLELDSTYRNRNEWPLAAEFVTPISMSGRKGKLDAVDPVTNSAIETVWQSNRFGLGAAPVPSVLNGNVASVVTPMHATTGAIIVIIEAPAGFMQKAKDYYSAAVLVDATPLRVRISSSEYMGTTGGQDRMRLTLNSTFPVALGAPVTITDPTDITSVTDPWLFVPIGKRAPNAYPGTILHNQTRNESRPVKDYQALTHLIGLDTSGSAVPTSTSGPISPTWTATDIYSIRPQLPTLCDNLTTGTVLLTLEGLSTPINPPNKSSFNLNTNLIPPGIDYTGDFLEIERPTELIGTFGGAPTTTTFIILGIGVKPIDDFYIGCTITVTLAGAAPPQGESRLITAYTGATSTVTVSPGFSVPPIAPGLYRIDFPQEARRIVKYVDFRGTSAASVMIGSNTIDLPSNASDLDGFYNNLYIQVGAADLRLISNYTIIRNPAGVITTRRATIIGVFTVGPGLLPFTITSGIVNPPFSYTIAPGTPGVPWLAPTVANYQGACILPFSYDNQNPFVYTGSLTSQQEMVCYEVELLNLVLPNSELAVGEGGNIAYYPYVYVELQNVNSASSHLKNIIYSNNPNATNMLFRAAVDDVPNPLNSSFIKIDGDGAVQTIKFKPNDNLKFSVRLQNGEIFKTILPEFISPSRPNPLSQISAYFSIKRV